MVELYAAIESQAPREQLSVAEGWLAQHPNSAVLLLMLGRLCLRNQLWGKARSYFEAAVGAGSAPRGCLELGTLLERLGDTDQANSMYRRGLSAVLGETPPDITGKAQPALHLADEGARAATAPPHPISWPEGA